MNFFGPTAHEKKGAFKLEGREELGKKMINYTQGKPLRVLYITRDGVAVKQRPLLIPQTAAAAKTFYTQQTFHRKQPTRYTAGHDVKRDQSVLAMLFLLAEPRDFRAVVHYLLKFSFSVECLLVLPRHLGPFRVGPAFAFALRLCVCVGSLLSGSIFLLLLCLGKHLLCTRRGFFEVFRLDSHFLALVGGDCPPPSVVDRAGDGSKLPVQSSRAQPGESYPCTFTQLALCRLCSLQQHGNGQETGNGCQILEYYMNVLLNVRCEQTLDKWTALVDVSTREKHERCVNIFFLSRIVAVAVVLVVLVVCARTHVYICVGLVCICAHAFSYTYVCVCVCVCLWRRCVCVCVWRECACVHVWMCARVEGRERVEGGVGCVYVCAWRV